MAGSVKKKRERGGGGEWKMKTWREVRMECRKSGRERVRGTVERRREPGCGECEMSDAEPAALVPLQASGWLENG